MARNIEPASPESRLVEEALRRRIGARIAAFRESREWSQGELARRIGVGRTRLGKWETGEHAPHIAHLIALKESFGVSLDELVNGGAEEPAVVLTAEEVSGAEKALEVLSQWLRRVSPEKRSRKEETGRER
jgi:transcriptional regulator with XRE-family HTH domain